MATINSLRHWAKDKLALVSLSDADTDTTVLLCRCLDVNSAYLIGHGEEAVSAEVENRFKQLVMRRQTGEPIAYIVGEKEFWSLPLEVSEAVLIPRPDTEVLVEKVIELMGGNGNQLILELGTGSGAIALAIASERTSAQITALDICSQALSVAIRNQEKLRLNNIHFLQSDWFEALAGITFDLICSNPPYVASGDHHLELGDVRFEPKQALVAGQSGMDDLSVIISQAGHYLNQSGWLLVEHGYDQAEQVRTRFIANKFSDVQSVTDLSGNDRVTLGRWLD